MFCIGQQAQRHLRGPQRRPLAALGDFLARHCCLSGRFLDSRVQLLTALPASLPASQPASQPASRPAHFRRTRKLTNGGRINLVFESRPRKLATNLWAALGRRTGVGSAGESVLRSLSLRQVGVFLFGKQAKTTPPGLPSLVGLVSLVSPVS